MTPILHVLIFYVVLTSCNNRQNNNSFAVNSVDKTKSFKLNSYWVTPKKTFKFNSLGKSSGDTLHLVTCSDYVYYPFGKLTDQSSISESLLREFTITNVKRDTFTNTNLTPPFFQWNESIDLTFADNKLNLFLDNDPEASIHGYIRGGQVVDSKVLFLEGIKIGININDFLNIFFDYFPAELQTKYNVVKFESCVTDITHIYIFKKGQLSSVIFISE